MAVKPDIPCTGVHIFTFAPKSRPIWLPYQSRPISNFQLKPRLRVTRHAERLARGQLSELHFWKFIKMFPYQSNSQNFFKFYCHFLGRREKGVVFPVPLAFRKSFEALPIG
jgi:hypothetical protein